MTTNFTTITETEYFNIVECTEAFHHYMDGDYSKGGFYIQAKKNGATKNLRFATAEAAREYAIKGEQQALASLPQRRAQAEALKAKANAPKPAMKGKITKRQADLIMKLIRDGRHTEGGFFSGPTTVEGVNAMTKADASIYITSLLGDY